MPRDKQFNNNHIIFQAKRSKEGMVQLEIRVVDDSPSAGIVVQSIELTKDEALGLMYSLRVAVAQEFADNPKALVNFLNSY